MYLLDSNIIKDNILLLNITKDMGEHQDISRALVELMDYVIKPSSITITLSLPYQPKSLTGLGILTLYSHYLTLQSTTPSPFTLPIVNAIPCAPLSVTHDGSSCVLSQRGSLKGYW